MNQPDDFDARAKEIFDRMALQFGRLAEVAEATTARAEQTLRRVEEIRATQRRMSDSLDVLEEKAGIKKRV